MKIVVDESGPFLIIYVKDEENCACKIDEDMFNELYEIDDISYIDVWNQVCHDVFGSFFFSGKNFTTYNYSIFYYRSRFKLIANMQKSHMRFTADMANLEYERIDNLLANKYGKQLEAELK